jgi:hypothetical protein
LHLIYYYLWNAKSKVFYTYKHLMFKILKYTMHIVASNICWSWTSTLFCAVCMHLARRHTVFLNHSLQRYTPPSEWDDTFDKPHTHTIWMRLVSLTVKWRTSKHFFPVLQQHWCMPFKIYWCQNMTGFWQKLAWFDLTLDIYLTFASIPNINS